MQTFVHQGYTCCQWITTSVFHNLFSSTYNLQCPTQNTIQQSEHVKHQYISASFPAPRQQKLVNYCWKALSLIINSNVCVIFESLCSLITYVYSTTRLEQTLTAISRTWYKISDNVLKCWIMSSQKFLELYTRYSQFSVEQIDNWQSMHSFVWTVVI